MSTFTFSLYLFTFFFLRQFRENRLKKNLKRITKSKKVEEIRDALDTGETEG